MEKVSDVSCRKLLLVIQFVVFAGWLIQLVFHQTWLCAFGPISWKAGFYYSALVSCFPLVYGYSLFRKRPPLPILDLNYRDGLLMMVLIFIGLIFWWYFSISATYYPVHTYGDETFHTGRVQLMAADIHTWAKRFVHHHAPLPEFRAEYMMYPALAYVPVTLWTALFGSTESITDQRMFLVVSYLAVILTTYLLSRLIIKSRSISLLVAMLPISSALLLAYTMSFYIELQYVSVLIFSFWLLALGTDKHSKEVIMTAVFLASLAPIIRESALAGTLGVIFAAMVWHYVNIDLGKRQIYRIISALSYLIIGIFPFFIYYRAKYNYSAWERTRTSFSFVFHQDYLSLLKYSFLYLGPIAILAILFFMVRPMQTKRYAYVFWAAVVGIGVGFVMQSIFLPGYMPWSRNYLFYYAQCMVLIILCLDSLLRMGAKAKATGFGVLIFSLFANVWLTTGYLQNNTLFHESEFVFDFRPITTYINAHQQIFRDQNIYVYWPQNFPTYPIKLLPEFVTLKKIDSPISEPFLPFDYIQAGLPKEVRYVLFYYLKNNSQPKAFHGLPVVERPILTRLPAYHILAESVDPWSRGRNGVILLEKI